MTKLCRTSFATKWMKRHGFNSSLVTNHICPFWLVYNYKGVVTNPKCVVVKPKHITCFLPPFLRSFHSFYDQYLLHVYMFACFPFTPYSKHTTLTTATTNINIHSLIALGHTHTTIGMECPQLMIDKHPLENEKEHTHTHFQRKQTNQKIMPTILILLLFFIGVCRNRSENTHMWKQQWQCI